MKKLRVTVNGVSYDVEVEILEDDDEAGSYGYAATNVRPQPLPPAGRSPRSEHRSSTAPGADANVLTSPVPGLIKEIKVKPGQSVQEHMPLLVIETMKMDTIISSPVEGIIKEIRVQSGQNVQQGEILVTFQ